MRPPVPGWKRAFEGNATWAPRPPVRPVLPPGTPTYTDIQFPGASFEALPPTCVHQGPIHELLFLNFIIGIKFRHHSRSGYRRILFIEGVVTEVRQQAAASPKAPIPVPFYIRYAASLAKAAQNSLPLWEAYAEDKMLNCPSYRQNSQ